MPVLLLISDSIVAVVMKPNRPVVNVVGVVSGRGGCNGTKRQASSDGRMKRRAAAAGLGGLLGEANEIGKRRTFLANQKPKYTESYARNSMARLNCLWQP